MNLPNNHRFKCILFKVKLHELFTLSILWNFSHLFNYLLSLQTVSLSQHYH